jgi:signal transduction histidine kinase
MSILAEAVPRIAPRALTMSHPTARHHALDSLQALVELCDVQQASIKSLQHALDERERTERDLVALRRMLAHELRTPLAAMIGTLQRLSLPDLPVERSDELRDRALRQARQLDELVSDLLHLADAPQMTVHRTAQEWIDIGELIEDVCLAVRSHVPGVPLDVEVSDRLMVRTVPSRVRQLLAHLLVHAADHAGGSDPVEMSARRLADGVCLEVRDRGPSLHPDAVNALFREPEELEGAEDVEELGLALYLVRSLTKSLGGTLELLPRQGGGTVARVSLPQHRLNDVLAPPRDTLNDVLGPLPDTFDSPHEFEALSRRHEALGHPQHDPV